MQGKVMEISNRETKELEKIGMLRDREESRQNKFGIGTPEAQVQASCIVRKDCLQGIIAAPIEWELLENSGQL